MSDREINSTISNQSYLRTEINQNKHEVFDHEVCIICNSYSVHMLWIRRSKWYDDYFQYKSTVINRLLGKNGRCMWNNGAVYVSSDVLSVLLS